MRESSKATGSRALQHHGHPSGGVAVLVAGLLRALLSFPVTLTYYTHVVQPLEHAGLPTTTFVVVVTNPACSSAAQGGVTRCVRDALDDNITANETQALRSAVMKSFPNVAAFHLIPEESWTESVTCAPWNNESMADMHNSPDGRPRSHRSFATRILQQWDTLRHGYRMIKSAEEQRGFQYEWILRTRTDTVFFEDIGAIIAASARDRVYVPRNGMSSLLEQRCQNDLLFWCPRDLCRPYFTVLELFDSSHCQGASRDLDHDISAKPSIFAERHGGRLQPNGKDGPPTRNFWLPFEAQKGPAPRNASDPTSAAVEHYEADWWFLARYSEGAACTSFSDAECCGVVDDQSSVAFALAQFDSDGTPSFIDCEARMLATRPYDPAADAPLGITATDMEVRMGEIISYAWGVDTFNACMNMSQMWAWTNDTDWVPQWRNVHKRPSHLPRPSAVGAK